jgi:anti-sigma-K factor RskA
MMDKEKFLASGLLEQYVLHLTTDEEDQMVELYAESFPEIAKEMEEMRNGLEQYAQKYAVPPPSNVKKDIMKQIEELEAQGNRATNNFFTKPSRALPRWASFLLLGVYVLFGLIMTLRHQAIKKENNQLLQEIQNCQTSSQQVKKQIAIAALIEDKMTQPIYLNGSALSPAAKAIVYWNPTENHAYLHPYALPAPPHGKQYQIWADVDGKMINLGLINPQGSDIQEIKRIDRAVSLNITIEPMGGSNAPNVKQLLANGLI